MKLLLDENIPRAVLDRLEEEGYDVESARTEMGATDERVRERAAIGRLLITQDRDFGELVIRRRLMTAGVLLVRLHGFTPTRKAALVAATLRTHGHRLLNSFTVLTHGGIRRQELDATDDA